MDWENCIDASGHDFVSADDYGLKSSDNAMTVYRGLSITLLCVLVAYLAYITLIEWEYELSWVGGNMSIKNAIKEIKGIYKFTFNYIIQSFWFLFLLFFYIYSV